MTYIELIQRGCCEEGVRNFVRKTGIFQANITPSFLEFVQERVDENDLETLLFALGLDGLGFGYGFGYGDGSGDGSGYGFGYGDGFVDGDGEGEGYGGGDGDGDGKF